jgi:hypothetical protein
VRTNAVADACWTIVDDATPQDIERLLADLAAAGANPIAARLDDDGDAPAAERVA